MIEIYRNIFSDTFIVIKKHLEKDRTREEGRVSTLGHANCAKPSVEYFRKNKRMPHVEGNDDFQYLFCDRRRSKTFEKQIIKDQMM